jgi:hypothetical protein
MRCYIGFFGLTRSLRYTADSIRIGFFEPLQESGFTILRAGHFNLPETITNPRSGEFAVAPDRSESALLGLDLCWVEPQQHSAIAGEFATARALPDAFGDRYRSLANLCHQLHSLRRLWSLLELLGVQEDDVVLLLRPDLLYLDMLEPASHLAPLLDGRADMIVPGWQSWGGLNDRFAFCNGRAARVYANRISLFTEACSLMGGMHAESFLRSVVEGQGLRVALTDLRAVRLRANGKVAANDAAMIRLPPVPPVTATAMTNSAGETRTRAEPTVRGQEQILSDAVECPRGPVASTIRLRRVMIDGLARVSPIAGTHYLKFMEILHRKRQVRRYLEIGTQSGMSLRCATCQSIAIDPQFLLDKAQWTARQGISLFEMTSDEFFASNDPRDALGGTIDLAFIDGMHLSEFVLRDFLNVERYCSEDSLIVLHDALPQNFEMTERNRRPWMRRDKALAAAWTGDVWRIVPLLRRERPDLCIQVLDCPPTGLLLVSGLNADYRISTSRLEELTRSLAERQPPESAFWSFIQSEIVVSSEAMFSSTYLPWTMPG